MLPTFKHISLWRLQAQSAVAKTQLQQELQAAVAQLKHQVPGLRAIELGIDVGGLGDRSDVALYSEFDSQEDVQHYIDHPAHRALVNLLDQVRIETRVVDYFTPSSF